MFFCFGCYCLSEDALLLRKQQDTNKTHIGIMKNKLKQKIAKWFDITINDLDNQFPDCRAKKFGDQKGVSFEMDLLVKTFCSVNNWASGEGFDISWKTEVNETNHIWEDKRVSLHISELECMLHCLNDLKYFESDEG